MKTVTIPLNEYNALRESLARANQVFEKISSALTPEKTETVAKAPKETAAQRKKRFDDLITGKTKVRKPDHLRKTNR